MKLYADYLRERSGRRLLERPEGFVVYGLSDDGSAMLIEDAYVAPERRRSGVLRSMIDELLREHCKVRVLRANAALADPGIARNLRVFLAWGLKPVGLRPGEILFEGPVDG